MQEILATAHRLVNNKCEALLFILLNPLQINAHFTDTATLSNVSSLIYKNLLLI